MKNRRQKTNKKQQVAIVESLDTKIAKAVYAIATMLHPFRV
jgi:hypothetical protein